MKRKIIYLNDQQPASHSDYIRFMNRASLITVSIFGVVVLAWMLSA